MKDCWLSVDGGGTKTELLLAAGDGARLFRARSGPSSVKCVGEAAARENLRAGLRALWERAGTGPEAVAHGVFGLSGCDSSRDERLLRDMIEGLGFRPGQYTLCNDAVLAFYAGAEPPGMVLIAGTGSIALGVDGQGRITRAGGWGYGFSDLGSGYWLGSRCLAAALGYCDGWGPWAPWFPAAAKALGAECLEDLPERAADITQCDRVAALAALLLDWEEPEPLRERILDEGSAHLSALLTAVYRRMAHRPGEDFRLVLAGGCMKNRDYAAQVAEKLPPLLRQAIVPESGRLTPAEGGLRLARRAAEGPAWERT